MTRDMTRAQFGAALKRNGFRHEFGGCWYQDTTGVAGSVSFGAVLHPVTFDLMRRATIRHLIAQRAKEAAKRTRAVAS